MVPLRLACVLLLVLSLGKFSWATPLELDGLSEPVREAIRQAVESASSVDLERDPAGGAEAWGRLGMLLQAQNLYEAAIVAYTSAVAAKGEKKWFYLRSICNIELGHLDLAVRDLHEVVAQQPDAATAWYRLGDVELRRGLLEEAEIALTRALSLNENAAAVQVAYAELLNQLGQHNTALEHLLIAASLAPHAGQIAYRVASTYRRLGDKRNHLAWLEKRNDLAPVVADSLLVEVSQYSMSANFFALAGQRAWNRGDYLDAVEAYRNAVRLDPGHIGLQLDLAHMLIQLGRTQESMTWIDEVLERDGNLVRALYLLAQVHASHGNFEASLSVFEGRDSLLADDTSRGLKAAILTRLGRFEMAAEEYGRLAVRHRGRDSEPYYRYWIGMNLYRSGDCAAGLANLRLVATARPDWGEALVVLSRMECACGNKERGVELARQLVATRDNAVVRLTDVFASLAVGKTAGLIDRLQDEDPSSDVQTLMMAVREERLPGLIFPEDSIRWRPPESIPVRVKLD